MITFKSLKFLSPDEGGGAAVADPPAAAAAPVGAEGLEPLPSIGEAWTKALDKAQADAKRTAEATGESVPAEPVKPAEPLAAAKPAEPAPEKPAALAPPTGDTAIDAAIDAEPLAAEPAPAAGAEPEFKSVLGELPEKLPNDKRSEQWEKARGFIGKIEGALHAEQKRSFALEKQVAASKEATPEMVAENEQLKKQNAEYQEALVAINVQYSPEHRAKFITGRETLVSKAASKLNAFGGKGELLVDAMKMEEGRARNQAIKEALADLEEVEKTRVVGFINEVEKLDDERAEVEKDPKGAWAKLQESEKARGEAQVAQREQVKIKIFDRVLSTLPKDILLLREVPDNLPGAAEHNARAKTIRENARQVLSPDAKPEHLIEGAFWREAGPPLQRILLQTRKQLREANAKLGLVDAATPGFSGGKPPELSEFEDKMAKTPAQIYQETLAKAAGR